MKRHFHICLHILGILALSLVLTNCGNKGRLYIPDGTSQEQKTS